MSDEDKGKVSHIHKHLTNTPDEFTYKGTTVKIHHRAKTNDYVWIFRIVKTTRHAGKAILHADAVRHAKRRLDIATQYNRSDEP